MIAEIIVNNSRRLSSRCDVVGPSSLPDPCADDTDALVEDI
jgi:hypothetical protein